MAHAVETMAYANEVPWHGLGAPVRTDIAPLEMAEMAGLGWKVEKKDMFFADAEGNAVSVPSKKALVRSSDNKVLTVVGENWHPLQNADALSIFKDFCEAGKATLETAGSLYGGKMVWALANIGHNFEVTKGDRVQGYVLLISPHEVGKSITCRTTSVRVVCANTMAMAVSEASDRFFSQSHRREFNRDGAMAVMEAAHEELSAQENIAKQIKKLKMNALDAAFVLGAHFQPNTKASDLIVADNQNPAMKGVWNSLFLAPGADPETGWGVLNAVTHYLDHSAGRSADTRMRRAWVGDTGRIKIAVQNDLLALAA